MIGFNDTNGFEICVMDLMENYKDKLTTAEAIETFSNELHQSIEIAIIDMLENGQFNDINPDDYENQY